MNVLSYSLFLDDHSRFLRYLYGLLCNVHRAKKFLPSWKIFLYLDPKVTKYELCNNIFRKCREINENFQIILLDDIATECEEKYNFACLLARYRPIYDPLVKFFAVRDLDSVMGILDIFFIKMFANLNRCFYCYRLYFSNTTTTSIGGGFSCNCKLYRDKYLSNKIKSRIPFWNFDNINITKLEREIWYSDEMFLSQLLSEVPREMRLTLPVRMKNFGGYYLWYKKNYVRLWFEVDSIITYTIPFTEHQGYLMDYEYYLEKVNRILFPFFTSNPDIELYIIISISAIKKFEEQYGSYRYFWRDDEIDNNWDCIEDEVVFQNEIAKL